jgi:hypothetical protein
MKKLYTVFLFTATLLVNAQSVFQVKDADNGMALVSNNQIFNITTSNGGSGIIKRFSVKNISAVTHTLIVAKNENTLNTVSVTDKAVAYFCFNTECFPATKMASTIELQAGESFSLYPELDEASIAGESNLTYEISDQANGSDLLTVELRYHAPVALVKEQQGDFYSSVSLFPNPASTDTKVEIYARRDVNEVSIGLYNITGALASVKKVSLDKGKNSIAIDAGSLSPGIYFVKVSNGNSTAVNKLIINK